MTENLKPCPACGGDAIPCATFVGCGNRPDCCLVGPSGDPTGAKWNALPRRTDASQGMSDGELIARAINHGLLLVSQTLTEIHRPNEEQDDRNGDLLSAAMEQIVNEMCRRAAARKESKP